MKSGLGVKMGEMLLQDDRILELHNRAVRDAHPEAGKIRGNAWGFPPKLPRAGRSRCQCPLIITYALSPAIIVALFRICDNERQKADDDDEDR